MKSHSRIDKWGWMEQRLSGSYWETSDYIIKKRGDGESKIVEQSLLDFTTGNEVQTMTSSRSKVNQERQANQPAKTKLKERKCALFSTKQGKDHDTSKETPIDAHHAQLSLLYLELNITSSPTSICPSSSNLTSSYTAFQPSSCTRDDPILSAVVAKQSVVDSTEKERFKYREAQP
jgi:hypothetical protein